MKHHAIPYIINNCWRSVPLPCGQYNAIFSIRPRSDHCHCHSLTNWLLFLTLHACEWLSAFNSLKKPSTAGESTAVKSMGRRQVCNLKLIGTLNSTFWWDAKIIHSHIEVWGSWLQRFIPLWTLKYLIWVRKFNPLVRCALDNVFRKACQRASSSRFLKPTLDEPVYLGPACHMSRYIMDNLSSQTW